VIRVVFDANILVSGFPAWRGTLAEMMRRWRNQEFEVILSEPILDEVERAWAKPYWRAQLPPDRVSLYMGAIQRRATMVTITAAIARIASHAEDDLVLATAISGGASHVVTGDRRLRAVGQHEGITMLTPREFVELLQRQENEAGGG
jgi:putative PIN family toxin of toxin-antitoxin system